MKINLVFVLLLSSFLLFGCGVNKKAIENHENTGPDVMNQQASEDKRIEEDKDHMSHKDVTESTWGELPKGIKEAKNPKFPVGTKVVIRAAHNGDMEGQEGVVVGAFDTTAYSVTYNPTTDTQQEVNYKWLVKEEVKGFNDEPLKENSEVIIYANRELGMTGAEGVIETVRDTTVYMVDYKTKDNREIKNYQWFIESELAEK